MLSVASTSFYFEKFLKSCWHTFENNLIYNCQRAERRIKTMKTITLKLGKEFEEIEDIIKSIKDAGLNIVEDCDDYTELRFVCIDVTYAYLEFDTLGVCIRNLLKPHLFVSIENKYLWALEVRF